MSVWRGFEPLWCVKTADQAKGATCYPLPIQQFRISNFNKIFLFALTQEKVSLFKRKMSTDVRQAMAWHARGSGSVRVHLPPPKSPSPLRPAQQVRSPVQRVESPLEFTYVFTTHAGIMVASGLQAAFAGGARSGMATHSLRLALHLQYRTSLRFRSFFFACFLFIF